MMYHVFGSLRVSIHVPLAEHDGISPSGFNATGEFQFTCPSRSTTQPRQHQHPPTKVSIHVPLAEHDILRNSLKRRNKVSIHVPLAEHDGCAAS